MGYGRIRGLAVPHAFFRSVLKSIDGDQTPASITSVGRIVAIGAKSSASLIILTPLPGLKIGL